MAVAAAAIALVMLIPNRASAQQALSTRKITLRQAVDEALERNPLIKGDLYRIGYQQALMKTAGDPGKTDLAWMGGQYNSVRFDNHFLLSQNLPNPAAVGKRKSLLSEEVNSVKAALEVTKAELVKEVKINYQQQVLLKSRQKLLDAELLRAERFVKAAEMRFKTGETNQLEYATAQSQLGDVRAQRIRNEGDLRNLQRALQNLVNSNALAEAETDSLTRRNLALPAPDTAALSANPYLRYLAQQAAVGSRQTAVQKAAMLPEFNIGYFNQSLTGFQNTGSGEVFYGSGKRFQGVQVGVQLPIFNGASKARIKASRIGEQVARNEVETARLRLGSDLEQAIRSLETARQNLDLYETSTLVLAGTIQSNATKAYESGEIGYIEYGQAWNRALSIRLNWLDLLSVYNQSVVQIEYLLNEQ